MSQLVGPLPFQEPSLLLWLLRLALAPYLLEELFEVDWIAHNGSRA